jgi:hypothetical protein
MQGEIVVGVADASEGAKWGTGIGVPWRRPHGLRGIFPARSTRTGGRGSWLIPTRVGKMVLSGEPLSGTYRMNNGPVDGGRRSNGSRA